jgi:hypothetical protein
VHAGAEVDQAAGRGDKDGEQVGGEHVDGEDVFEAVFGLDALRLPVADPRVVDHRVVASGGVGGRGDLARPRARQQIADQDRLG